MPLPNRCEVCGEPTDKPVRWCISCSANYDRTAHEDGSVMEAILWAARRARWYAERRAARNAREAVAREARLLRNTTQSEHIRLLLRLVDSTLENLDNDRLGRALERARIWLRRQR